VAILCRLGHFHVTELYKYSQNKMLEQELSAKHYGNVQNYTDLRSLWLVLLVDKLVR